MRPTLAPLLLHPLMSDDHLPAAPLLCKLLLLIATPTAAAPTETQPSHAPHAAEPDAPSGLQVHLHGPSSPSPHALMLRLFAFAGSLGYMSNHLMAHLSERALHLLLCLAPFIHPALPPLWANHLPKLIEHLKANPHIRPSPSPPSSAPSPSPAPIHNPGGGGGGEHLAREWSGLMMHLFGDSIDVVVRQKPSSNPDHDPKPDSDSDSGLDPDSHLNPNLHPQSGASWRLRL